jgi:hypothetical protein
MVPWLALALVAGLQGPWSPNPVQGPEAALAGLPQAVSQAAMDEHALALQCRRALGPWRACLLTIESLGRHWWLQVGQERWVLRADGRGGLTLATGKGPARPVQPLWLPDRSLCWDGHCIKGSFPLD